MAAYEYFAATTTNTFIEHIKTKAEAYGWTIDYYTSGRVHLHNSDDAHFEVYASSTNIAIRGCTGYDSEGTSATQPNTSAAILHHANAAHFVVICPHSIFIKSLPGTGYHNVQFGYIGDKIGSWTGGICISYTHTTITSAYSYSLWGLTAAGVTINSQVLINGSWTASASGSGGSIAVSAAAALYSKMPFAYSGGILPVPLLLFQRNPTTTANLHPIGYAPDVRFFSGGTVYTQLQEIQMDGETWIGVNQEELNGTFLNSPNLLIRLAEAV